MGRSVSYPQFVDFDLIQSKEVGNYRYWLKIPFKYVPTLKTLCVILKNPSDASDTTCDNTVCKVSNVAYNNGYSAVIILNLFPYRSKKAKYVTDFYEDENFCKICDINLSIIKKMCKKNDVVFAWGTNTISKAKKNMDIYNLAISKITSEIWSNVYYVKSCNCANESCNGKHQEVRYPLHGLRWHNDSSLSAY